MHFDPKKLNRGGGLAIDPKGDFIRFEFIIQKILCVCLILNLFETEIVNRKKFDILLFQSKV
jgi:hypothetical protein